MGVLKIRQIAIIIAIVVVLVGVIFLTSKRHSTNTTVKSISTVVYTNAISGTSITYYANKGLEIASSSPTFFNSDALANELSDAQFSNTITVLTNFVATQSHGLARQPVISNVTKSGSTVKLTLFIDSNELYYDVTLNFSNGQTTPTITYKANENETVR